MPGPVKKWLFAGLVEPSFNSFHVHGSSEKALSTTAKRVNQSQKCCQVTVWRAFRYVVGFLLEVRPTLAKIVGHCGDVAHVGNTVSRLFRTISNGSENFFGCAEIA